MQTSDTTPFSSSLQLQTVQPTVRVATGDFETHNEARYWAETFGLGGHTTRNAKKKKYAHYRSLEMKSGSAVVHQIIMGPTASSTTKRKLSQNLMAVACGPRVPLYGTTPQSSFHRLLGQHSTIKNKLPEADRQVTTGGQLALCVSLRVDGRLLAIGSDAGVIRVADTTTRATLCQFKTTASLPIRAVQWFRNGQWILAAGDDAILRVHQFQQPDVPLMQASGHGDAIRCAELWQQPISSDDNNKEKSFPCLCIAATGSYDHTVRLWNMECLETERDDRCLAKLDHGAPVEALVWIKSHNPSVPVWLVSAGGTRLNVWNPVNGHCVCSLPARHRKTITALVALPKTDTENDTYHMRLLTAGLDGLIRIHSWDTTTGNLTFLHGVHWPDTSITALSGTFQGDRIAIGTANGTVIVRQKGPSVRSRKQKQEPRAGTYAFFTRGMNAEPATSDHVVEVSNKKRKLSTFDIALKKFRYGDALDEALNTRVPQNVVAVLQELGRRQGLAIALGNRDEETLEPILAFVVRYISRPRYSALLIGVANKIIDIYGDVSGQSETIDELFVKLKRQVHLETRTQKALFGIAGQLEALMTRAVEN